MFEPGWLERQLKRASEIVASWPKHKQEAMSLNKKYKCPTCRDRGYLREPVYGDGYTGNSAYPPEEIECPDCN